MTILLLPCSASKKKDEGLLPAEHRYTGSLFRVGMTLAEEKGFEVIILSAKFGFIAPSTPIPFYNDKLKRPYSGNDWPDGSGFFLGGSSYFQNAPSRFQSLVEMGLPMGEMVSAAQKLLKDPGLRSGRGVTATLYSALRKGKCTKVELRELLDKTCPTGHPRMYKTIDIQLRQGRIGDERNCWLRREGDCYWLEPKEVA